jgi:hypothetical protein
MRHEELSVGKLIQGQYTHVGLKGGAGNSTNPEESAIAGGVFFSYYLKNTAATGTARGFYQRLYLSGGAGGESVRAFTTVMNNAPVDTVNGAHISLNFGASAGNVTGLGTAVRGTVHVPGRSLTGTIGAIQAEIYGDAAQGAVGGIMSLFRGVLDGHNDLKGSFDDNGYLLHLDGVTAGAAHVWRTGLTAATLNAATTCALRIRVGGTVYFIPVATAATG